MTQPPIEQIPKTLAPLQIHPKVVAGGIGASASIVVIWVLTSSHVAIPPYVASAITGIVTFACSYLKASDS